MVKICVKLVDQIFFIIVVIVIGDRLQTTCFFLLRHLGVAPVLYCAAAVLFISICIADCPVRAAATAPETVLCATPAPCTSSMYLVMKRSLGRPVGKEATWTRDSSIHL
jgi:hypothetical protein